MMKCPKCGFEQPDDLACAKCGIVVKNYLERLRLTKDPTAAIGNLMAAFVGQIKNKHVFFAPNIPEDFLTESWLRLANQGLADGEEEVLMLGCDAMGRKDGPTLILTTKGIMLSTLAQGSAYDYSELKEVRVGGFLGSNLILNGRSFDYTFLAGMQSKERETIPKMIQSFVNLARSAKQNNNWKARVKSGQENLGENFMLRQAGQKPIPILRYEKTAEGLEISLVSKVEPEGSQLEPAAPEASPLPVSPGANPAEAGSTANTVAAAGAARAAGQGGPVAAQPGRSIGPAPARDEVIIAGAPPATGKGSLLANVIGLLAGAFIIMPVATGIAAAIGFSGKGPHYVGLFAGAIGWNVIASAIKNRNRG